MLGVTPKLSNKTLIDKGGYNAIGVDAANALDHLARHRLVVGNDGKRFKCGLRKALRVPGKDKRLDLLMECRMSEQAPSAGNLAQLDATVFFLVFNLKLGKKRRAFPWRDGKD